jgi:signal transduction histidine kinase
LKFLVLICVLLLFWQPLPAQKTLPEKLEWYENFFRDRQLPETGEMQMLAEKRLQEAIEIQDIHGQSRFNKELGLIQLTRVPDYGKAIEYFIKALKIENAYGLKDEEVITYIAMARVFEEVGDYYKSAELLEYAMSESEAFHDNTLLIHLSNKLGKLNALKGNHDGALENYELVLKKTSDEYAPLQRAEALFNKAHVLSVKKNYDEALKYHKEALALRRKSKDRHNEAQSLNDIGEVYRLMKNEEQALKNFVAAIQIRTEQKDVKGLAQSYNNAGILYFNRKNFERAIANLELGLESARSAQSADHTAKAHEFLSYCYKETGAFQTALAHTQAYMDLVEFMRNEKAEIEILEAQNRYVIDQKELEIRQLEVDQRQQEIQLISQKKIQNFLFTIIGFGVIIVCLIFFLYLTKRRATISLEAAHARVAQQNAQLQNLNATKDKFFSIISHDLKGPLNSFTSLSRMLIDHTDDLTKDEIQMLAKEIDKNLKNLFALLENLLEWSRSQTGNIEFKPEEFDLNELLEQNQALLKTQAGNKGIAITYNNGAPLLISAHRHSVNTVIRNLISNAIKFTPEGGQITLSTSQPAENQIRVSVADNGIGMSKDTVNKLFRIDTKYSTNGTANEKGTGLGLILCKDFIEKNGGSIGVESTEGKGSVFYFTLPLQAGTTTPARVPTAQTAVPL